MLSEQELTTILQMLQKLCQHMGVNVDSSKQEVQSFAKHDAPQQGLRDIPSRLTTVAQE